MKIMIGGKFYALVVGIIFLGLLIILGGLFAGNPTDSSPALTVRGRLTEKRSSNLGNTLEGKATINELVAIPKGVLMVFTQENTLEAATFGDIAPDGRFCIGGVSPGKVSLVFRPDTETILDFSGASPNGQMNFKSHRAGSKVNDIAEGKFNFASEKLKETAFTAYLKGLPDAKRYLIVAALSKYGKPQTQETFQTTVVQGVNRINIDFKVP